MRLKEVLSFDDVLLVPQYSDITSRKNIQTKQTFQIKDKNLDMSFKIPIISSPMSTITEYQMANSIAKLGGLGIIHRYNSIEEQVQQLKKVSHPTKKAAAVGCSGDNKERTHELVSAGANYICIDVAHGDHIMVKETIEYIKTNFSNIVIIAGNVATGNGYRRLSEWGADFVRTSVGSGSICTTRVQTGHGIPTLQAVFDCNKVREELVTTNRKAAYIIADGGIKNTGDIAKSIAAGADLVMLGSMISGTEETPGEIKTTSSENFKYKEYNGMASKLAQEKWKGSYSSVEGVTSLVPFKGYVSNVIDEIIGNLKSAMSYSGSNDFDDFRENVQFVRQTQNSFIEGNPHILNKK